MVKKILLLNLFMAVLACLLLVPETVWAVEARWVDRNNISIADETFHDPAPGDFGGTFVTQKNTNSINPCKDKIDGINSANTTATLTRYNPGGGCNNSTTEPVTFAADSVANATTGTATGTGTGSDPATCEGGGGALAWIACPIISLLDTFFKSVDASVQNLLTVGEEKYRDDDLKESWAAVRNIAYSLLILVMLIMVIGTALGFSVVDAYSVKKSLPRLVIAVMFIALSWEITGFMIQLSNDFGRGMLGIISSPLSVDPGNAGLTLEDMFSPTFGGAAATAGAATVIGVAIATPGTMAIVGSFLMTASLIILTALLVLIARQLFILALIIFLPIAIIAWIFPGNDKLWKLSWGTFTKLLLMFPLITALIGVGRVFAFIVGHSTADTAEGVGNIGLEGNVLGSILKLVAYIIPYALIPYTFKAAGGIFGNLVGMANDREKGVFDRIRKNRQTHYERAGRNVVQKRADWQNRLQKAGSSGTRYNPLRVGQRKLAGVVGGYNIQAADSARRAHVQKELNDQIATGRDDEIRGLTVNKRTSESRDHEGRRQFRTLGGAWVDEATVDAGHKRWGKDTYAQQAALSHEMRKAGTEEELQHVSDNYQNVAKGAWNMTDSEAGGAWIGAAFDNQGQNLQFKHTSWNSGGAPMELGQAQKYISEVYEKKGSYPLSQMSSQSIQKLKEAHSVVSGANGGTIDPNSMARAQSIAGTFMHELGGGGQIGVGPNDEPVNAAGGGSGRRMVSTPGAAHVAERVREFAEQTGARIGEPSGTYVPDPTYYGDQGNQNREHK